MTLLLLGGESDVAALESFKGSFAADTDTGAQAITGVGFQPKLVIFWGNNATAADTPGETNRFFLGAATASDNERVSYVAADDNAGTMNVGRGNKTDACVSIPLSGTPTDDGIADLTSMDADGFTLNWSDAPAAASLIHYLALGGDDLSVKLGGFTTDTDTGAQSVTGVGFQGDSLLMWTTGQTTVAGTTHYRFDIGCATDSTHEWTVGIAQEDGATTSNVVRDNRNDACLTIINHAGVDSVADFTGFTADGFDLNWSDAPGAAILVSYIVLGGIQAFADGFAQPTSNTTVGITGVGFEPSTLFGVGTGDTDTGFESNSGRITVGASDPDLNQGFVSQSSTDNAGDSVEWQVSDTDKTFGAVTTSGGHATMDVDSYDVDGFTFTSVGTTAAVLHYFLALAGVAEEETPAGFRSTGGATFSYYYGIGD
jgi:hypothetical protein